MTAADPRDGLPEAVAVVGPVWTLVWAGDGPIAPLVKSHGLNIGDGLYTADQMHAMYERGKADALAHARPEAVDGVALTSLRDNEKRCETCGRAVWNGVEPRIGWWAPCGNLVARIEDCGKFPTCVEPLTPDQSP